MEVKVYKQKVKHLLYEQEHSLAELKAENMVRLVEVTNKRIQFGGKKNIVGKIICLFSQISLKVAREEHQKIEQLHLNDKRQLGDVVHAKDKQYQEILRNMKLQQSETVEKMRQSFEERVREIEKRYSDRFVTLRSELQLR